MFFDKIKSWLPDQHLHSVGRIILLAGAVGIVAGFGAIAFQWCTHFVSHYALDYFAGYRQHGPHGEKELFQAFHNDFIPLMLLVVPTIGGLLSGFIVFTLAPEAEGHGTDAAIDAYHNKRGIIRAHVPIIKMITSAITLGTGGSGGREGPIAQIGAGFGSFLATKLKLSDSDRRILLAAGVGAGIGAIFRAPLAGAIFATEVLYRDPDFESEALIPAFIATTAAYCVFGIFFGFTHLFTVQALAFNNPMLLIPLTALAMAMAAASLLYVRTFYGVNKIFHKFKIMPHFKPAIGAFLTGLLAVILYYFTASMGSDVQMSCLSVLSAGYGFLQNLMIPESHAPLMISILLIVGIGKILTTSLTIGSGGSGGVFGPSMVIGGSLGAVVGLLFQQWMPSVVGPDDVVIFVLLGMASFFSAAANCPVSTLIMVSEMTASYTLLLPSMWVCALSYLVSRNWSIYKEQVRCRLDSPTHRSDFIFDILEGMSVHEARLMNEGNLVTVPLDMQLKDVVKLITDTTQICFPVVDRENKFYGLFSLNDIRAFLYDNEAGELAIAQDLANTKIKPVMLDTDLSIAMGIFARINLEELPIVNPKEPDTVIGLLRRQDILSVYNSRLTKLRSSE